ncbi:P-loop containing nucleoside triphosphate hydrolase protein [Tirmania nivea]|nr:P-loop containing nucleoside triphosphate hydrolase protein [Tirmania nivea]
MENISITVCGDGGTGKSSISLRLVRSKWTNEYDPTIQDSYSTTRVVDGRTYQLALTDTAGQEEYRGLWATSNLNADGFLLVYDITSHDSLAALDYFNDLIDMDLEDRPPGSVPPVKIVAGNKCDLANSRQVSSQEGLAWARAHNCGFMETSARNVVNIEETFALLVRRVVAAREAAANGSLNPVQLRPIDGSTGARASAIVGGGEEKDYAQITGQNNMDEERPKRRKGLWATPGCCVIS